MNELVIQLTGEITETNFDEWKKDLITQIESVNKDLQTDGDFDLATDQVKTLKGAEKALKEAKASAIEQAADIQKLFAAIDEVSSVARDARLTLERQIRDKKEQIKEDIVNTGIGKIRALLETQSDDFQRTQTGNFTDRQLFESVMKGKRGTSGAEAAVGGLVDQLTTEIGEKATAVEGRAKKLDRVDAAHKPLFQDRAALLDLVDEEFDSTLAERIQVYEAEQAAIADAPTPEPEPDAPAVAPETSAPEPVTEVPAPDPAITASYRIAVRVRSDKAEANQLAEKIQVAFGDEPIVEGIDVEPA